MNFCFFFSSPDLFFLGQKLFYFSLRSEELTYFIPLVWKWVIRITFFFFYFVFLSNIFFISLLLICNVSLVVGSCRIVRSVFIHAIVLKWLSMNYWQPHDDQSAHILNKNSNSYFRSARCGCVFHVFVGKTRRRKKKKNKIPTNTRLTALVAHDARTHVHQQQETREKKKMDRHYPQLCSNTRHTPLVFVTTISYIYIHEKYWAHSLLTYSQPVITATQQHGTAQHFNIRFYFIHFIV